MKIVTVLTAAALSVTVAAFGRTNHGLARGTGATTTTANTTTDTTVDITEPLTSPDGLGFPNTTVSRNNGGAGNNAGLGAATAGNRGVGRSFDQQFLRRAVTDSQQEILLGSLAQTNSEDPAIQQYGQQLIEDHTASIEQAQVAADSLGITLPDTAANPPAVPQRLSTATGTQFDRQFITLAIQSHLKDINLFESAALRARNADVRAYARAQLPVLMQHLVAALEIRESLISAAAVDAGTGTGTGTDTGAGAGTGTTTDTNTGTGVDP